MPLEKQEHRCNEELEFRHDTVSVYIENFLASHSSIKHMEKLSKAMFEVELKNNRNLRVFTTNTYFFTEYTFYKVMAIDPAIDAIICSCPMATYTDDAKALCIEHKIGLFKLREFMGAIHKDGEDFLNYLLREEQRRRVTSLQSYLDKASIPFGFQIYVFGSYIRRERYKDIDLLLVYSTEAEKELINSTKKSIYEEFQGDSSVLHITVCSEAEYQTIILDYDNRIRVK